MGSSEQRSKNMSDVLEIRMLKLEQEEIQAGGQTDRET